MARASIYEFAGGDAAWLAFTTAFHELCLVDPELNHPFSHSSPHHTEHLASYWAEVFGGPGATPNRSAADDAGLPDDPEFRATIRSYIEWAVREVDAYQAPGSVAPTGRPMPHWSWNGREL